MGWWSASISAAATSASYARVVGANAMAKLLLDLVPETALGSEPQKSLPAALGPRPRCSPKLGKEGTEFAPNPRFELSNLFREVDLHGHERDFQAGLFDLVRSSGL
jgi:hypothetical protein